MRWLDPLDEILGSRAKVRILRCLSRTSDPLTGREISRRIALSHTGVLRALRELGEQNIVGPAQDGSGVRFLLNRAHDLVRDALVPLFVMESSLDDRVADFVMEAIPSALSITIFGSVARGEDRTTSDLDVFVVVPAGIDTHGVSDQVGGVEAYVRFGKLIEPIVWTLPYLRRRGRERAGLVAAVIADGKPIWGSPVEDLITERGRRAG